MATPQDYIRRFFAGMQQRNRVLIDKINRKREIDERIRNKGARTDMDKTRLIQVIGTDNKLHQGRLEDQSIRYLLWKSVKSANFLEKWKNRLLETTLPEEIAKEIQEYISWISAQLLQIKKYAAHFEDIYTQEIESLKTIESVQEYLQNTAKEEALLGAYIEFGNSLAEKTKPRMNKTLYLIKKYQKKESTYKATIMFLSFMAFILGVLPLLPGPFAPKSEETPLFPIFAAIATALYATTEGRNILANIKATLERFQKEVWTD